MNLDYDLNRFYKAIISDKTMLFLTRKLCGSKNPTTQTVFEALVDSIVEQQISLKAANSIENKSIKKFGAHLNLDGAIYYAYPTPQELASVSTKEFRQCDLSTRKDEYIKMFPC